MSSDMTNTVPAIIDAFGGNAAFARAIGKIPSFAGECRRRQSIPVEHWPAVMKAAAEKGIEIDERRLMLANLARKEPAAADQVSA